MGGKNNCQSTLKTDTEINSISDEEYEATENKNKMYLVFINSYHEQ